MLANFTPGHRETWANYANGVRAPLLFIAGSADHIMPPAVNKSNAKHYGKSSAVTDFQEFPGRSHYTLGQEGREEVADYAPRWATEKGFIQESNGARPNGHQAGRTFDQTPKA